jgi:hypothetical protein
MVREFPDGDIVDVGARTWMIPPELRRAPPPLAVSGPAGTIHAATRRAW